MDTPEKKKPTPDEISKAKRWPIWEKEESKFDWHYDSDETFLVLEGEVTVKYNGGKNEISFGAGDLVTMPEGMDCTWHVNKKIRKHYHFS